MMITNEIRLAALTLAASFVSTFAYLWQRAPSVSELGPMQMALSPSPPPVSPPILAAPAPVKVPVPAEDPQPVSASAAPTNVPPENLDGPVLPALVGIAAQSVERGADIADGTYETTANQVDLYNTSEQLLAITLIDFNAKRKKTSSTQVVLMPNGQAHIRADAAGLTLESGDTITLRSTGFRDMTQSVP